MISTWLDGKVSGASAGADWHRAGEWVTLPSVRVKCSMCYPAGNEALMMKKSVYLLWHLRIGLDLYPGVSTITITNKY